MKAWLLDGFTGVSSLRLADVPAPQPAAGEVVVRVRYAALNPADRYLAEKQYPARPVFPHILGRDGMGTIAQVGAGIKEFQTGDRVLLLRGDAGVNRPGTLAEFVAAPVDRIVPIPSGWSDIESAGAALVYVTAYQALTMWGDMSAQKVLITGASGGVGIAAIQLSLGLGHTVVAMSRGQSKVDALINLGASAVVDPSDPQWRSKAREAIGGDRFNLAIDNIGGTLLPQVIDVLGENGKVAAVGRLAGPVPQFNTAALFFRRIHLRGVYVGAYTAGEAHAAWRQVTELLSKVLAKPVVDQIFPFEEVPAAFARLAEGPLGKVIVSVTS